MTKEIDTTDEREHLKHNICSNDIEVSIVTRCFRKSTCILLMEYIRDVSTRKKVTHTNGTMNSGLIVVNRKS